MGEPLPVGPVVPVTDTTIPMDRYDSTAKSPVPLPWPKGATSATAVVPMSDADIADQGNKLFVFLEHSFDGGKTFKAGAGVEWVGSVAQPGGRPNTGPSLSDTYSGAIVPTHTRVRVETVKPLTLGAVLTVG